MLTFTCTHCKTRLSCKSTHSGKCFRCPKCTGKVFSPETEFSLIPTNGFGSPTAPTRRMPGVSTAKKAVCLLVALSVLAFLFVAVFYGSNGRLPDNPLAGPPETCKELVERLQRRGLEVEWRTGNDPVPSVILIDRKAGEAEKKIPGMTFNLFPPSVKVLQLPTEKEARELAGTTGNGFAYGRFLIVGDPVLLEKIKSKIWTVSP